MIARTWRGAVRSSDAEAYLAYLRETGLRAYAATPGNRGVMSLVRTLGDRAEFLLVSLWRDEDAIRQFAGADIDQAVFYPEDDRFLIDRDLTVAHWEVPEGGLAPATGLPLEPSSTPGR